MRSSRLFTASLSCAVSLVVSPIASAQTALPDDVQFGDVVPPDVEQITSRALEYLATTQHADGSWRPKEGGSLGRGSDCGVVALAVLALISTGEDMNVGPYATNVHSAIRYLISNQNPETGFFPTGFYHHGFALLALAEVYGNLDEEQLWSLDTTTPPEGRRSIASSMQLAIGMAVNSQKNNRNKAWRYQPTSQDADTSITGAVLMGLLASRNAGIAVPDSAIEDACAYLESMTSTKGGQTIYTTQDNSPPPTTSLSAITSLTLKIAQKQDSAAQKAATTLITSAFDQPDSRYPRYNQYYMGQALLQSNYPVWERWNLLTTRRLRKQQLEDGSFDSNHGKTYATAMSCLALALNYRFLPIYER